MVTLQPTIIMLQDTISKDPKDYTEVNSTQYYDKLKDREAEFIGQSRANSEGVYHIFWAVTENELYKVRMSL